jgi:hypothetical protein
MDTTLVISIASMIVILIAILGSLKKMLDTMSAISAKVDISIEENTKQVKENLSIVKSLLETHTKDLSDKIEQNLDLVNNTTATLAETSKSTQVLIQSKFSETLDIINTMSNKVEASLQESQKQIEENITTLKNLVENNTKDLSNQLEKNLDSIKLTTNTVTESTHKLIESKFGETLDLISTIPAKVDASTEENTKQRKENLNIVKNLLETHTKDLGEQVTNNLDRVNLATKTLTKTSKSTYELLVSKFTESIEAIQDSKESQNEKIDTLSRNLEKNQINYKNIQDSSFQNLVQLVNNIRLNNLVDISNELAKYKNGVIENKYFLQEIGDYKIMKFTDKKTHEVTEIYYDDKGHKSYTKTFVGKKLKYEMKFNKGVLKTGLEYNDKNQVIFAYEYDEAGEVSMKIEYEYNKSGKKSEKNRRKY